MSGIAQWLADQLQHNPVFSGAAGLSLMGGVVFWLRSLPARISSWLAYATTLSVTFDSNSRSFDHLQRWLAPHMRSWWVRQFRAIDQHGDADEADIPHGAAVSEIDWLMTVGAGRFHILWRGRPYRVSFEENEPDANRPGRKPLQRLTVTSYGFSRAPLLAILDAARAEQVALDTVSVFLWRGWWRLADRRRPRPLDTVDLPAGMLEDILADIARFRGARERYAERGIPYRRGYLFAGEPGTGKSTTAFALASYLRIPIYVLNLSSIAGDEALFDALGSVPARAFVLIEDIDAAQATHERQDQDAPAGAIATSDDPSERKVVSLSGLLNAIDGVFAKEGRMLIMTSNYADRLDRALLRPGRVDRRWDFGLADASQAMRIVQRFFPDWRLVDLPGYAGNLSPAEIQGVCQNHEGDLDAVLRALGARAAVERERAA